MDRKEIENKVIQILADTLGIKLEKIQLQSDLLNELGMDSMGAIELAYAIEEAFEIDISEDAFKKIQKVQDIVDFVEKCLLEKET